jgi:hypothetical protein
LSLEKTRLPTDEIRSGSDQDLEIWIWGFGKNFLSEAQKIFVPGKSFFKNRGLGEGIIFDSFAKTLV